MKYKLLLTGTHQPIISDFFNHMDSSFECLSSSTRTNDVLGHLKYYEPQCLILCLNKESIDDIRGLHNIVYLLSSKRVLLIVVGNQENCSAFEKIFPFTNYLAVVQPISTKGLETKILKYLDSHYADSKTTNDKSAEEPEGDVQEEPVKTDNTDELINELMSAVELTEPRKKKHVLVIDDDSRVLKLVKSILESRYDVATAISGKVAMKFLENKETDLILLDYEMPGDSGAEILQQIRNNEKLQKLPVVFLTGVTERERIHEVLALSPQGYLLKPINAERLNNTLEDIFGKQ